jgi:hypothetical protein
LREVIARAVVRAFERTYREHGCSYDPDTCYEAADEVIGALVEHLTGQTVDIKRSRSLIAPALFDLGNPKEDLCPSPLT